MTLLNLHYSPPQRLTDKQLPAMQEPAPQFVTDDKNEIAIRTDCIESVSLVVEGDETKGRVSFIGKDDFGDWTIPEKSARQIIRRLG